MLTHSYSGSECCIAARNPAAVPSAIHLRLEYIQVWAHTLPKCPSQQGQTPNFKTVQSTDRRIEWTRPPGGAVTVPVTLLHPVFGEFFFVPTSEDNAVVLDLSLAMSEFFENEGQWQETFINIMCSRGIVIAPSSSGGYHTDGDVHVNGRRYMILKVKSEFGSKGAKEE